MKLKINSRFQRSFRVSKKMETGGMDFNDQITKTFFNNVFNNETDKTFIGFFIPAISIVYCTMFHGMNNQFEILRVKNGTTTTLIKVTKSFTTVNSTTNDNMDWEFTNMTSSTTRTAKKPTEKRKTKWVSPTIIKEKEKKKPVFAVELLATGWINVFFFARRPVATVTTTTTIPKTIIEKIHSELEKKILNQYRGQKLKLFHENLVQKWGEFPKKNWTGHHLYYQY